MPLKRENIVNETASAEGIKNKLLLSLSGILFFSVLFCPTSRSQTMNTSALNRPNPQPRTIDSVDLHKYLGTWYEIARIPNSFEKSSSSNVTATYSMLKDGRIEVLNRCLKKDGTLDEIRGVARSVDSTTNSKLEVSFVRFLGFQLFWGDYWIIGLDKDYQYAVIGSPTRTYGWILSRTPVLLQENQEAIFEILKREGYDPKDFIFTEQK
jgi:apolipoprotein D and lipocalin family protein